jgi:hypothetical protein
VAVAPEPVKQDLIDNEILESVPKTMKAKVQLLLKKMKSSPDISWNEKGELKYKGETVQGSNVVVDQVLFHGFRCDCHVSGSVIVVDVQISSERLVV